MYYHDKEMKEGKTCFDCMQEYELDVLDIHQCKYCQKWFCDDCWNPQTKTCFTCEIKNNTQNSR